MAFGSGLAYGFAAEVEAPLVGAGLGGAQVVATNVLDAQGTFGAPWVPSVWPSNGEAINTATGSAALIAAALSAAGKGGRALQSPKARHALIAYGTTALMAGWIIPGAVRFAQGGSFLGQGRRARGAGARYAYLPYPEMVANAARQGFADRGRPPSEYGSGITSQANQQVLRKLFTSQ